MNLAALPRHDERKVRIHRVRRVVVRKGAVEQLVEDMAVVDVDVVAGLLEAPRCQVARRVVNGVEAVAPHERDGVGKRSSRDGKRGA